MIKQYLFIHPLVGVLKLELVLIECSLIL